MFRNLTNDLEHSAKLLFISSQILVSHALGDAFSPFLVGVLSDWIRPALKPIDSAVPIVTTSANVLPYSTPIFIGDDMVIL